MTCQDCRHSTPKLRCGRWRFWCRLYKRVFNITCLDFKEKKA